MSREDGRKLPVVLTHAQLDHLHRELARLEAENLQLRRDLRAAAERIAGQSEALSHRANRKRAG